MKKWYVGADIGYWTEELEEVVCGCRYRLLDRGA